MKITILTLFPKLFDEFINTSILGRAVRDKKLQIEIVNFRNYSLDKKHNKVDDTPYGGGSGMVLSIQPLVDAINDFKQLKSKVILLTPSGSLFKQSVAKHLLRYDHLILLCGHYEGFDERIKNYIDFEISIGDYILTGGEIPAMVLTETICRLIPSVIKYQSVLNESFEEPLLDFPTYTKPQNFEGYKVPNVLLKGNHKDIENFRLNQRIIKTKNNRPDLYEKYLIKKGVKDGHSK